MSMNSPFTTAGVMEFAVCMEMDCTLSPMTGMKSHRVESLDPLTPPHSEPLMLMTLVSLILFVPSALAYTPASAPLSIGSSTPSSANPNQARRAPNQARRAPNLVRIGCAGKVFFVLG